MQVSFLQSPSAIDMRDAGTSAEKDAHRGGDEFQRLLQQLEASAVTVVTPQQQPNCAETTIRVEVPQGQRLSSAHVEEIVGQIWRARNRQAGQIELQVSVAGRGEIKLAISLSGERIDVDAAATDGSLATLLSDGRGELSQALARWGLSLGRFSINENVTPQRSAGGGDVDALAAVLVRDSYMEVIA